MPRGPNGEKRHADTVLNAVLIGRIAAGEVEDLPSRFAPYSAKGSKSVAKPELERRYLIIRLSMRRFTRLTDNFEKQS
jgi:hypothetical protein